LEGWIWRAVVNAARNARRAEAQDALLSMADAAVSDGDSTAARELIAILPERQRMVLFLRYFADMTYDAIAETLEISPGTVGATLNAVASQGVVFESAPSGAPWESWTGGAGGAERRFTASDHRVILNEFVPRTRERRRRWSSTASTRWSGCASGWRRRVRTCFGRWCRAWPRR
jgi:hypothetical protein